MRTRVIASFSAPVFYEQSNAILHNSIPPPHNGKKKQLFMYCKGDHSSSVCDIVTVVQKRLEIGKRGYLCFNCLGSVATIEATEAASLVKKMLSTIQVEQA